MRRGLAYPGEARQLGRPVRPIACLAFVALMAAAFWAGAAYVAQIYLASAGL